MLQFLPRGMAKLARVNDNSEEAQWGRRIADLLRAVPETIYDFFSSYFRLEIEGAEHVPQQGRGLIVPNHSDALGLDAFMLLGALRKVLQVQPWAMAHRWWFSSDFLNAMSRSFDLFPADLKEGLGTLKKDRLIVIFPEGEHGNFKVSSNMYRLVEFNPGFVPLAIMQRAPVIPTVIMGAEEAHFNLGTTDIFKQWVGADVPLPLNIIPFPSKWKIKFLKPIDFAKYSKNDIKDPRFVKEINQNIRYRIQHAIDKELKKRTLL